MNNKLKPLCCFTKPNSKTSTVLPDLGKKLGFQAILSTSFLDLLKKIPELKPEFIIIDCSTSPIEQIAEFFQKMRSQSTDSAPGIVMIVESFTQQMIAISAEYSAIAMLTVKSLPEQLEPRLEKLLAGSDLPAPLKAGFIALDKAARKGGEIFDDVVENLYTKFPQNPRIQFEYANLCIRQKNFSEAEEISTTILANSPGSIRAYNIISRIYMLTGRHDEAQQVLTKCDLLSPANVDRLVTLGDCYLNQGQYDKAKEKYGQALSVEPESKDAKKGLGVVELSTGDINTALELLNDLTSEEELASIFNNAAVIAIRDGDMDKGLKLYNSARGPTHSPDLLSKIVFNMGLAYKKHHHFRAAEVCFAESFRLDPVNTKAIEQHTIAQQMAERLGDAADMVEVPEFENSAAQNAAKAHQPVPANSPYGAIIKIEKKSEAPPKKKEAPRKDEKPAFSVKGFMEDDD